MFELELVFEFELAFLSVLAFVLALDDGVDVVEPIVDELLEFVFFLDELEKFDFLLIWVTILFRSMTIVSSFRLKWMEVHISYLVIRVY